MEKIVFILKVILKASFVFFLFLIQGAIFVSAFAQEPLPLLVIERDVPRIFNRIVAVNHRAYVVNLSDTPVNVDLRYLIPKDLYREEEAFFGKEVELDLPLYYPQQVEIKEYQELGQPVIKKGETEVIFAWKNVSLSPNEAAVIQFENYLGPLSIFYTSEGFDFSGLRVEKDYESFLEEDIAYFSLHYDIKNLSDHKFEFFQFEVFFPDTIMMAKEDGGNVQLLDVNQYCMSSNAYIQKWIINDGFGNQVQAYGVLSQKRTFSPGEQYTFFVNFTGKRKSEIGEIYPLLIVRCRIQGVKLLNPLIVQSEKNIKVGRFYYTEYATSIPDSQLFKFEEKEIKVVSAEKFPQSTFVTIIPQIEGPLTGPVPPPPGLEEMEGAPELVPEDISN